jgi:replicative DNA helicase
MVNQNITPANIDAEEAILGGILLDPGALSRVIDYLVPEAFYASSHRLIYNAMTTLYNQSKPTDYMAVTCYFSDRDLLEKVGGTNKLAQLLNRTVSAVNIDRYTEIVMDKYKRRCIIQAGNTITELGYDTSLELKEVYDRSEQQLYQIKLDRFSKSTEFISEPMGRVFMDLEDRENSISTGLIDLDKILDGGIKPSELVIVAGRPSMGKTWFGAHLARACAQQNKLAVFFTAEMSNTELAKRFLSMESGIDSSKIRPGIVAEDIDRLVVVLGDAAGYKIILDDTPAGKLTPNRIKSTLRSLSTDFGKPELVVIDYIQKLGDRTAVNRAQVVGAISGEFKDIAKEFGCGMVALAQINRGVEGRQDKRPMMSDLKDSGDIEQDADVVITLYRDEYYHPDSPDRGIAEINIAKQRNGAVGIVKVKFDPRNGHFTNLAPRGVFC